MHPIDRPLFRHIPDTAGIIENDIRLILLFHQGVPLIDQRLRDLFRVTHIHLATVGLDVDRGHASPHHTNRGGIAMNVVAVADGTNFTGAKKSGQGKVRKTLMDTAGIMIAVAKEALAAAGTAK